MFFGYYEHSIDAKGRLVIPSKFRNELGDIAYILKGFDGSLSIYKASEFEKLINKINSLPFNKKDARAYIRIQLASTCELEIDKQGRVQIPSQLLSRYEIGKEVVVIGVSDHFEVWDKAKYDEYENQKIKDFDELGENLDDE